MASKYQPLTDFLLKQNGKSVTISFDKINSILGFDLPSSASDTNAITWWANDTKSHVQTLAWLNAGYKTQNVSSTIRNNEINFVKESNESSDLKFVRDEMSKDDELYKLAEYGVPRTHIECLIWFRENEGKVVDNDTIKGIRVKGRNENGFPFMARRPIPADEIVKEPHYIHGGGVRGSYKPGGAKIVGYDEENRRAIWEGEDNFVQAIQTGNGELEGYGKEIKLDGSGSWREINYNHDAKTHARAPYYEITGGHLQRCHDKKIPIGVVYKQTQGQNKIMGLGLITKVSKNKLEYKIEPYKMSQQSTFSFVKKDFDTIGSVSRADALYRSGRFSELRNTLKSNLSSNFDKHQSKVGQPHHRGQLVTDDYKPYTWLGFWEGEDKFDTLQFQVALSNWEMRIRAKGKQPQLSAGVWFEGKSKSKKLRMRMLEQFQKQKVECFQILKKLPSEYVVLLINDEKKLKQAWNISQLTEKDLDFMINELQLSPGAADTKFKVARFFTEKEALDFKTGIVSELAETFEKLLPLERLLTGKSSEGEGQSLDDIADQILRDGSPEPFELAIEKSVVVRILRHLDAGKNVILVGAPGVGKTELAKRILSIFGKIKTEKEGIKKVATNEWTRWDVIGGMYQDEFHRGCVTEAVEEKAWLLIDEFNRADINKAFGEMFLAVEDKKIPLKDSEQQVLKEKEISIPPEFRIIGTMNDFDKNLLLTELSYGLITRFAFVDIKPEIDKEKESVKLQIVGSNSIEDEDYEIMEEEINEYFTFINKVRLVRMIGVRTNIDIIRYMVSASNKNPNEAMKRFLDEAMCDYLLPQFDRLDRKTLDETKNAAIILFHEKNFKSKFTEGLEKMIAELERIMAAFENNDE